MAENRYKNTYKSDLTGNAEGADTTATASEKVKNDNPSKKTKKPSSPKKEPKTKSRSADRKADQRGNSIIGVLLLCIAIFLGIALVSYLVSYFGISHQEYGSQTLDEGVQIHNVTGRLGARLAEILVKESFGIGAFFFVYLFTILGLKIGFRSKIRMWNIWKYALMGLVWLPLFFAFLPVKKTMILGGAVGQWLHSNLLNYIGSAGVVITLVFTFLLYAAFEFNLTFNAIKRWRERRAEKATLRQHEIDPDADKDSDTENIGHPSDNDNVTDQEAAEDIGTEEELPAITVHHKEETPVEEEPQPAANHFIKPQPNDDPIPTAQSGQQPGFEIVEPTSDTPSGTVKLEIEETPEEASSNGEKEHHGLDTPFDPHYELRDFKFPSIDLLRDYGIGKADVSSEELEENKNKIVETLGNYGIQIDRIKATIGPTVTLYEIVPAAGVRISKIKNLEDDIALSLSALGIRIIAPIPGRGTIGIEVPNSKPETVSMKSVLMSEKFQSSKYALPFAMGKTISNETYVADLAKMPHLLMAGATGQGKSVGLNAIITSLLYCKHPSELKFVMVDPKKVELTLYNRIERHYLAKLPDMEEAIITDVKQVVRSLNSLCVEMDDRYDLLKMAECRNIIEYNEKFKARRLLPTEGHRFLPYIVLVVDEFADLISTAGREVESPIARLAQLARAIGIHLIIATQRPSVNIITGSIKANFPARIAFRVTSVIDSRTILDQAGANQLIGRGDMLLSTGNDVVRLQCAFIDTPEVEKITSYIGEQRGYRQAYMLPEVAEDAGEGSGDSDDDGDRDSLFEEAARIVVQTQQGSTSMIQRKLKLGYNRAGRIIDQLEAAGIVGPFAGSKTREVKVANEFALEQILKDLDNRAQGI